MSGNKATLSTQSGMSTLVRARFGPGMLLHHDDLEQLNTYTRELSRLLFRSFFGCGVVCGLKVGTEPKCGKIWVTVEAGLALDGCGDPVYVPKDQRFTIDEKCDPNIPARLWVILCGKAKCCAPRTPVCSTDDSDAPPVCTRERDGFEISVVSELPKCVCGCPDEYREPQTKQEEQVAGEKGFIKESGDRYEPRFDCRCVDPRRHPCYCDHYAGKCGCPCDGGADCACDCILLARLDKCEGTWEVEHKVRRFIRPLLMIDPAVYPLDCQAPKAGETKTSQKAGYPTPETEGIAQEVRQRTRIEREEQPMAQKSSTSKRGAQEEP